MLPLLALCRVASVVLGRRPGGRAMSSGTALLLLLVVLALLLALGCL